MSKYSDHTTVGGQVLAHRVRMMKQNWNVIWIVGCVSFLLSFIGYHMFKYKTNDIWNYLCIAKAVYRDGMTSLPSRMFSSSYFWFNGRWQEFSDYTIAANKAFLIMKANFETSLIFGFTLSVIIGIISMIGMVVWTKFFGKSLSDKKELISGHDYVDAKTLRKAIKHKSDITLADIPYPKHTECRHTILTGTTGSGKTNVMIELLQQVVDKKERAIVVDTVGTYVDAYFRPDRDVLINPFDYRSLPWSFIKECGSSSVLLQEVAMCLVPDPMIKVDNFWHQAARTVFIESVKKVVSQGKGASDILQMLKKPTAEQQEFLKDTYGANIMNKSADKMAISVNTTLINATNVFQYLKEGDEYFSIKEWIKSGSGLLFLSCTPAQRAAIIPMITAWLTIASEAIMQIPETKKRTWFFIDELHNLNRLPKIETSLAEIRKFGGCFVIGTQMISQLNTIYDHETARTITGLCGTKIVMNVPEPITAQYMSKFLGDKEEVSTSEAISYGANTMRDGVNIAQKNDVKEVVSPSEIMSLKTGEAFIRFADMELIGKVKFKHHELNANL